jgi:hypothetical protein
MSIVIAVRDSRNLPTMFFDSLMTDGVRFEDSPFPKAFPFWNSKMEGFFGVTGDAALCDYLYSRISHEQDLFPQWHDGAAERDVEISKFVRSIAKAAKDEGVVDNEGDYEFLIQWHDAIYTAKWRTISKARRPWAAIGAASEFISGAMEFGLDTTNFDTVCESMRKILKLAVETRDCIRLPIRGITYATTPRDFVLL